MDQVKFMDAFVQILNWLEIHIPAWIIIALVVFTVSLLSIAYLILLERKVASWAQDRIGPNRVGLGFGIIPVVKNWKMWGLGQPFADGLKFLFKEDYRAKAVDVVLFSVAPMIMMTAVIISIAVLPWGGIRQTSVTMTIPAAVADKTAYAQQQFKSYSERTLVGQPVPVAGNDVYAVATNTAVANLPADQYTVTYRYPFQIANLNIGVLYVLATLALAVYGVVLGGWASNNKYSFLGGLRATANMISYEIPLGLAVLAIVVMCGSLDLGTIVEKQCHSWLGIIPAWNIFTQPLAFVLFLVCIHAEANRSPFDLAEAEQELVGGYHTEYSSMRFALFFLAEYAGMITTSSVCVALFFGGWDFPLLPFLRGPANDPMVSNWLVLCIVRALVFYTKTMLIIFIFMWVRWSLPRFRFDQMMALAWRGLIPIALLLLMVTTGVVYWYNGQSYDQMGARMGLTLLAANMLLTLLVLGVSRLLPAAPATNRRVQVANSRFNFAPIPKA